MWEGVRFPLTRRKQEGKIELIVKLGSEILRTVVVRELQEIFIVAGIIALRAVLTFLIHWEIKNEEKESQGKVEREKENA